MKLTDIRKQIIRKEELDLKGSINLPAFKALGVKDPNLLLSILNKAKANQTLTPKDHEFLANVLLTMFASSDQQALNAVFLNIRQMYSEKPDQEQK